MGKMLEECSMEFELNLIFDKLTREEHLDQIINLMDVEEETEHHITIYELKYNSSFELDCKRYMYAYLKCTNSRQAINLYDSLLDEEKLVLINVIKIDHPHLAELIDIHEEILFHTSDAISNILQ